MASTGGAGAAPAAVPATCRIALVQLLCGSDKAANLAAATAAVREAAANRADIVALPECFNSPYATDKFPEYAEPIPACKADIDPARHPSTAALSAAAAAARVFLVGGSIPERDEADGRVYNTCVAYGPDGELLARHRKMHLFDIDIPGRMTFRESDTLSAGRELALFDTPWGRAGLGICYDMRFPYLGMLLRQAGADFIFFPGAFNTTTGPAHWELLLRARALDAQAYVAGVSPARNPAAAYQAWGHSTLVSPWGEVAATTDEGPGIVYADARPGRVAEVRAQIPVSQQARADVYSLGLAAGAEAGAGAAAAAGSSTAAMVERERERAGRAAAAAAAAAAAPAAKP
jgi:omega-amidase